MSDRLADESAREAERLANTLRDETFRLAAGLIDLTADQLADLGEITGDMARALAGDKRAELHVTAQLKLRKFSTEARAYLEVAAFRKAMADALLKVAGTMLDIGARVAAEALASALTAAVD